MEKIRLAILASGSGTTTEAIIKSKKVDVALVVTNNKDAAVVEKAQKLMVEVEIVPRAPYKVVKDGVEDMEASRLSYGQVLLDKFAQYQVNWVSQNGWMVLTPENVVEQFEGRIVNQHPGPLDPGYPDFGGVGMYRIRVHAAVLNFARRIKRPFQTEATIHQVNEKYDQGELLMTHQVEILDNDSPETLQKRVLPVEHQLQIDFWQKVQNGGVTSFKRTQRLILPGEEKILEEAKKLAIEQYQ